MPRHVVSLRRLRDLLPRAWPQAAFDFAWANIASDALHPFIVGILSRLEPVLPGVQMWWVVLHLDATRLLVERYLRSEYFDVIDVDSFGSEAEYIRAAFLLALKIGGLLYLTSTDWCSARGYAENGELLIRLFIARFVDS